MNPHTRFRLLFEVEKHRPEGGEGGPRWRPFPEKPVQQQKTLFLRSAVFFLGLTVFIISCLLFFWNNGADFSIELDRIKCSYTENC